MKSLSSAEIQKQQQDKRNRQSEMEKLHGIERVIEWLCIQYDKQHWFRNSWKWFLGWVALNAVVVYYGINHKGVMYTDLMVKVMVFQIVLGWLLCLFSPTVRINHIYDFNEMILAVNGLTMIVVGLLFGNYTAALVGLGFFGFTIAWSMYWSS